MLPQTWWIIVFIELVLHQSNVNQMYSQPLQLTHELILCVQITTRRAYFYGDFAENPCGLEFSDLQGIYPKTLKYYYHELKR